MRQIKHISFMICIIYIFMLVPVGVAAVPTNDALQNNAAVTNGCHSIDASNSLLGADALIENVTSAFVYEVKSDTLMYAMNADERMYPSSLVKILTALMAVERGNLDDMVTVREDVLSTVPYDAVSAELQPGEIISLRDLLYCMMVGSANDAAAVIADYVSGSQDAFVAEMNDYARSLGCAETNFVNVHGLHDEQQYTTARDMTRILSVAVKNEDFVTCYSAVHYTVPATNKSDARELSTGNFLMNADNMQIYYDARVTGGRTGTTEDGKRCLAVSAESNGMQLVCILMGAESEYDDAGHKVTVFGGFKEATTLFDAAFDGHQTVQVLHPGQTIIQQNVLNGDSDVILGSKSAAFAVLPEGITTAELRYEHIGLQGLEAPVKEGDTLASVQIWHGNICVAQTDLIAMNSVAVTVPEASPVEDPETNSHWKTVLIVIVLILVSIVVLIFGFRFVSKLRYRIKQNRHRKARRRSR